MSVQTLFERLTFVMVIVFVQVTGPASTPASAPPASASDLIPASTGGGGGGGEGVGSGVVAASGAGLSVWFWSVPPGSGSLGSVPSAHAPRSTARAAPATSGLWRGGRA